MVLTVGLIVNGMFTFDVLASYVGLFSVLAFIETIKNRNNILESGHKKTRCRNSNYQYHNHLRLLRNMLRFQFMPLFFLVFIVYEFNIRPGMAAYYGNSALDTCSYQDPSIDLFQKALGVKFHIPLIRIFVSNYFLVRIL